MMGLSFSWDPKKNKTNQTKHGISFDETKTAFYDENGRLIFNPDHSSNEDRFLLLGISNQMHLLVVCHTYRSNEKEIRIISARSATKSEQRQYNSYFL